MSEEWLEFLRENAPNLHREAVAALNHSTKWRDKRIRELDAEAAELAKEVDRLRTDLSRQMDIATSECNRAQAAEALLGEIAAKVSHGCLEDLDAILAKREKRNA